MNNKKGVSGVVTAVLLILLVIAAVGILAVVIQNFVKEGTSGVEGAPGCFATTYDVLSVNATSTIIVKRISGDATVGVLRGAIGTGSSFVNANNPAITIGETTTINGTATQSGTVEVSLVYALTDGTACPAPGSKSIGVT